MNEQEKKRNSHIDYSRSSENKYLARENIRELYKREFGESLEIYNKKQTRSDRKINNYFNHIESSKKTATQQEMIIQVGDKVDFSSAENREVANAILEEWFQDFEKRNPNLKVYNAVIHNDEASPHLHLNFVPVASGYKRGLEKQVAFDRAIKQQDSTLNKTRPFDDWREKEVQLLENKLKERGIERKFVGTNDYKDVNEYKEKKDLEREIEELKKVLPDEQERIPFFKKETESVKTGFMKSEEKETGNYVLSAEQYNSMTEQIHSAVAIKKDYKRLKSIDLNREYEKTMIKSQILENRVDTLETENHTLKGKNLRLEGQVYTLEQTVKDLKREIAQTYKAVKEFVIEYTSDLKAFKTVFKGLVDNIKDKTSQKDQIDLNSSKMSEFDKVHKRETRKEMDRGMER